MPRFVRLAFIAFAVAGLLSACGKRGQLEPPPSQTQTKAEEGEAKPEGNRPKRVPIKAPKRDLPIDFLLD